MVCLSRPYNFRFSKGSLPQILLGPFLNTLSHILFILKKMTEHPNVFLRSFSVSRTGKHKFCILGKIFERLCSHVQTENTIQYVHQKNQPK